MLLEQIRRTDDQIRSYVTVCNDALILAETSELQLRSGSRVGMLHGIPLSFKDILNTRGVPTKCGSKLMQDYIPTADCTAVERVKQEGGIVLGKLSTHEFAVGGSSQTRNPWNTKHISGGSSAGSAAAVAALSAIASIGSDTGGSIRIPAAFCGVVGLKPTYGRVSRAGVFPQSWSLDHVGPITRRVEDAALLLNLIAGYDELDPTTSKRPVADYAASLDSDLSGLRIGVPKAQFYERCDDEISKTVLSGISVLEELGCVTSEIDLPHIPEIMAMHSCIEACEQSANHLQAILARPEEYAPDVRSIIERGLFIPSVYYIQALRLRSVVAPKVLNIFSHLDAIIIPSQPFLAPPVDFAERGLIEEDLTYTAPFNLTGLPALSVPCGFSRTGLPIGMQVIGDAFDEQPILRIGNAYEQVTKWYMEIPELASK